MAFRLAGLLICIATLGFTGTWSGYAVSSGCYASAMNNMSQDGNTTVSRDMEMVLRQCAATHKTKHFAIVQNDWTSLKLDAAGNDKAAAIIRSTDKRRALYCITVNGVRHKNMLVTGSITIASGVALRH